VTRELVTIVLYVSSVSRSAEFYQALGFDVDQPREDYASVAVGGQLTMSLHEEAAEKIEEFRQAAAIRPRGAGAYYYFEVPDIHAWSIAHGDVCSYPNAIARPWGKTEMLVVDPDGYLLMFYS